MVAVESSGFRLRADGVRAVWGLEIQGLYA